MQMQVRAWYYSSNFGATQNLNSPSDATLYFKMSGNDSLRKSSMVFDRLAALLNKDKYFKLKRPEMILSDRVLMFMPASASPITVS